LAPECSDRALVASPYTFAARAGKLLIPAPMSDQTKDPTIGCHRQLKKHLMTRVPGSERHAMDDQRNHEIEVLQAACQEDDLNGTYQGMLPGGPGAWPGQPYRAP
jgi:hypothetical protein